MKIRITLSIITSLLFLTNSKLLSQTNKHKTKSNKTTMKYIETFNIDSCEKISLLYFKKISDKRDGIPASKTIDITDKAVIQSIIVLLKKLPDKGDEMIKMGDVEILEVVLIQKNNSSYFTFYKNAIKTPDTSFYSNSPQEEKVLYNLLMEALKK
jgi:hypothetical protein